MVRYEIVIIGGGPAGLAAAVAAQAAGAKKIVILERDERLGGILKQVRSMRRDLSNRWKLLTLNID